MLLARLWNDDNFCEINDNVIKHCMYNIYIRFYIKLLTGLYYVLFIQIWSHMCIYIYIQMHTTRSGFDSYRNVPNGKMTLSLLMAIQCRKIIMRNQLPFTFHVQISSNIFSNLNPSTKPRWPDGGFQSKFLIPMANLAKISWKILFQVPPKLVVPPNSMVIPGYCGWSSHVWGVN